jgi:hypothetical protein
MPKVRPTFASKNYVTGQQVRFKVYSNTGAEILNQLADEWDSTGVYFLELNLNFSGNKTYLVIAEEVSGTWKASKLLTQKDTI